MDSTDPTAGPSTHHQPLAWTQGVTPETCYLLVGQLCQAIQTRDLIGQAKGRLMEREHIDADAAFAVLVDRSQRSNTPLRQIVQAIVDDL